MRILILCAATFAAGLLAGTLFEDDPAASRARRTDDGRGDPAYRLESARDGATGRPEPDAPGPAEGLAEGLDGGAARLDVRSLTAGAARTVEELASGDSGGALLEADGKITGVVRDTKGNAVSGVVVTAVPESRPFELSVEGRRARERAHENRDLGEVARTAIENELWRRHARRVATSDVNGRFELHGLLDVRHLVTAFHEKYEVVPLDRRNRVQPDSAMEFVARPVVLVRVSVKNPEGAAVDHAWLSWEGPDGRGGDAWLREPGTVRLPLGKLELKATVSLPDAMESEPVECIVGPTPPPETVVLQLEGRRILTARLAMPDGFAIPDGVEYRMRRVEGGDVEPASLLQDQSQRLARTPSPGRAHWYDLEPGRYLIAAFLHRDRLLAHAVAEVGEGPSAVDLPVEEPEAGTYVKAKLLGPDGGPVPGHVSFRVTTGPEDRPRTVRADAMRGAEEWLVFIDKVKPEKDEGDALLRVGTRDFGGAIERFRLRGGGTIVFRFDQPAKLMVELERYGGSGVEGSLFVALRSKLGADAWRQVAPDGTCALGGVQPGDYELMLYVRRQGKNYPIFKRAMRLRPGEDEMRIAVPALHTLNLRYAGKAQPKNVVLRCRDESIGWMRLDAPMRGRKASFPLLAAGTYEIECNRKRTTVRVPGAPEVVLP